VADEKYHDDLVIHKSSLCTVGEDIHTGVSLIYLFTCTSVSIVSECGLNNQKTGVRSLAEARDFSSRICVQTDSEATQPPVQWVLGVLYPVGKVQLERDTDHSPPSSAVVKNE
jgi:hypothetical protein